MKFSAKGSKDFEAAPAGNFVAICNAIVDLGVQPGRGQYPDPKPQVYLRFELPTETVKFVRDGVETVGPMSIGRDFTASMSEKANLRKFVESWFGKKFPSDDAAASFDFKQLLGRKCLVNITHTEKGGKTYANIANATPIPKGMPAEYKQHNDSLFFDLTDPSTHKAFEKLPEWLRKKIDGRIEEDAKSNGNGHVPEGDDDYAAHLANKGKRDPDFDDDIPFSKVAA